MLFYRNLSIHSLMLSAVLAAGFVGCSDDSSSSSSEPQEEEKVETPEGVVDIPEEDVKTPDGGFTGTLMGACEKGPFVTGSTVKLTYLSDVDFSETDKSVSAAVADDRGRYALQYSGMEAIGKLEASGNFLHEITGDKSGTATLRALVRSSDGDTANVNVLTHLEYPRILFLMKEKSMSFIDARKQAEGEVLKAFHLDNYKVHASKASLFGVSDADANLLAATLLLTGENASADIQKIIDNVAADIEKDGTWDDEDSKAKIADWAYLQSIDQLVFYIEDLANNGTLPNFFQKFRTFWFETFGLGTCDSTLQGVFKPNTNKLSEYVDKEFICSDTTWRIASAAALQNREGEALFGACTADKEGTIKASDDKKFICKKEKWKYATEAELLNVAVSEKNGACTAEKNASVVEYESNYMLCQNSTWQKLATKPVDYTKGRAMNEKLGQGINLGNAWESKGTKGASADCGWNNCIKDEYFKIIKDAGFKSVRLPVRWNYDAAKDAPYTLDAGRLSGVKADIDLALAQGLVVIVNFHHYEELINAAINHDNNPDYYENEKKRFFGLWEQVAKEMDAYSDDQIVLEILNEPHGMKANYVDELMLGAYEVIRKNAPGKTIMFEGNGYAKFAQISNVKLPADGNIIFTGHYYEPYSFSHQGHGYDCGTALKNTDISAVASQFKSYVDAAISNYPDINGGHIPMNMGEFGVSGKYGSCGGNGPSDADRAKWTDAVIKAAESYGMSWQYWGLVGVGGFEAYNKNSNQWYTELLDVFKKYL